MKLVVLDGYTLNPGDLDWKPLERLGETAVYDRTPEALVPERAADADIVLTNKTPLSAETLEKLPKLKYIGVLATGYNIVDVGAAAKRGIPVTNVPGYGTEAVAQHVFALILELCSRIGMHDRAVHEGDWATNADFCFTRAPLTELSGKTLGIVGYGAIGRKTAQVARAFGMRAIAMGERKPGDDIERLSEAELFAEADIVTLHCPLTPETENLIDAARLRGMKRTALLVNTARGKLIDERALADALNEGAIAGAGLDVLSTEPPSPDNPLLTARNCVITPHIAWAAFEARRRLLREAIANLEAFQGGELRNAVNRS